MNEQSFVSSTPSFIAGCTRQALAILEDDREIVRVQGRGTFVASRKLTYRPTGLAGLVTGP